MCSQPSPPPMFSIGAAIAVIAGRVEAAVAAARTHVESRIGIRQIRGPIIRLNRLPNGHRFRRHPLGRLAFTDVISRASGTAIGVRRGHAEDEKHPPMIEFHHNSRIKWIPGFAPAVQALETEVSSWVSVALGHSLRPVGRQILRRQQEFREQPLQSPSFDQPRPEVQVFVLVGAISLISPRTTLGNAMLSSQYNRTRRSKCGTDWV